MLKLEKLTTCIKRLWWWWSINVANVTYRRWLSDYRMTRKYGLYYLTLTREQKRTYKKRQKNRRKYGNNFLKNKKRTKLALARRDGPSCRTCIRYNMQPLPHLRDLTIDHIVRIADGGTNDLDNLQLLCVKHHRIKDDPKGVSYRDEAHAAQTRN